MGSLGLWLLCTLWPQGEWDEDGSWEPCQDAGQGGF